MKVQNTDTPMPQLRVIPAKALRTGDVFYSNETAARLEDHRALYLRINTGLDALRPPRGSGAGATILGAHLQTGRYVGFAPEDRVVLCRGVFMVEGPEFVDQDDQDEGQDS